MVFRRPHFYHPLRHNFHVWKFRSLGKSRPPWKTLQDHSNGKNGENAQNCKGAQQIGEIFE